MDEIFACIIDHRPQKKCDARANLKWQDCIYQDTQLESQHLFQYPVTNNSISSPTE